MHCISPPTKEGLEEKGIVGFMVENNGVIAKENGKVMAKSHNSNSSSQSRREQSLKLFPERRKWVRQELLCHKCQRLSCIW